MMFSKDTKSALGSTVCLIVVCFSIPFMLFIGFPFVESFSTEKRLERFITDQCIAGNEVAVCIRRQSFRYYKKEDYPLVRAAIEGNQHAIRALKLEPETTKRTFP